MKHLPTLHAPSCTNAHLGKIPHTTRSTHSVLLVNEADEVIGYKDKLQAHQQGLLHRAFSVFIFRRHLKYDELLLQQRARSKYHGGGLWTNTCCSHPLNDNIKATAVARLQHEMRLTVLDLKSVGVFHYTATMPNQLIENEIDHVFIGFSSIEPPLPNPHEVATSRWIEVNALQRDLRSNPSHYTPWLAQSLTIALQGL